MACTSELGGRVRDTREQKQRASGRTAVFARENLLDERRRFDRQRACMAEDGCDCVVHG